MQIRWRWRGDQQNWKVRRAGEVIDECCLVRRAKQGISWEIQRRKEIPRMRRSFSNQSWTLQLLQIDWWERFKSTFKVVFYVSAE